MAVHKQRIMNKYKYRTTNKVNQEIWVCEACKNGEIESILTGNWKLETD